MGVISQIASFFQKDSELVSAIKILPSAYQKRVDVDFMFCEDKTHQDWLGQGDPVALAEIKSIKRETGDFTFFFVIQDKADETSFDRFKSQMRAVDVGSHFTFSCANESVLISKPATTENLQAVLELAVAHCVQV